MSVNNLFRKAHYETIARTLALYLNDRAATAQEEASLVSIFIGEFMKNPSFDASKFFEAVKKGRKNLNP
jgi:hypothetical protein